MHQDVIELRRFYYQRALGRVVQRALRERLAALWPVGKTAGMTVAGFGFPVPLLRPYLAQARRVTALMPGPQGVMGWPAGAPNHAALCDETAWPLDTGSVDRLILLHGLEVADHPDALLAEAWRVLGPGGRMVVVAPNRAGLWARSDTTPFGYGRSYTAGQMDHQLRRAGFVTEGQGAALYVPPSDRRFWLRTAAWWERAGSRISSMLVAGVIVTEASKQLRAPIRPGLKISLSNAAAVLGGLARPEAAGRLQPRLRRPAEPNPLGAGASGMSTPSGPGISSDS